MPCNQITRIPVGADASRIPPIHPAGAHVLHAKHVTGHVLLDSSRYALQDVANLLAHALQSVMRVVVGAHPGLSDQSTQALADQ